jgi:hypothetical protein
LIYNKTLQKFDESKSKFSTYIFNCVRWTIGNWYQSSRKKENNEFKLEDLPIPESSLAVSYDFDAKIEVENLKKHLIAKYKGKRINKSLEMLKWMEKGLIASEIAKATGYTDSLIGQRKEQLVKDTKRFFQV